jgi:hypothetical protein
MATTEQGTLAEGRFDGAFDSVNFTDAIALIEAVVGVKPKLVQEYDLTKVDPDERVQIRIDKNNAPREMVERFAAQMAFSVFPPIVVTQDDRTVDGNTRVAARRRREDRYCPALQIPISWDESDDEMRTRLEYLGLALNNSNGKALDRVERRRMVRDALELGMTTKQITATVGFPASVVNSIRHEVEAEAKTRRVGKNELVDPDQPKLRDASLRALGRATDLNDQPFAELAQLTADAAFNANEVSAMASAIREVGSDELALERIERERDANAQRIADLARGGNGHPPAARVLRQRLGFIDSREAAALVETNRERMQDHLDAVEAAIEKLTEVAQLQREALAAVVDA